MAADPELDNAQHILEWIVQKGLTEFSKRDAHHALGGRFKKADDLDGPLQLLINLHFLTLKAMPETSGPGRKPSQEFRVDAEVFEMGLTELTQWTQSEPDADQEESFVNSVNSVVAAEGVEEDLGHPLLAGRPAEPT